MGRSEGLRRKLKKEGKKTFAALKVEFENFMHDFFDDLWDQFGKEFLQPLLTPWTAPCFLTSSPGVSP